MQQLGLRQLWRRKTRRMISLRAARQTLVSGRPHLERIRAPAKRRTGGAFFGRLLLTSPV